MIDPELSVVLADPGRKCSIDGAVAALERGSDGVSTELIVVRAGSKDRAAKTQFRDSDIRFEFRADGTLTPQLWGTGLSVARGRFVAFTTGQMRVGPNWAQTLLSTIREGAVGVAGPIELALGADTATAAAYFLRFSAFTPEAWPASAPARDIPGDNAAYRRDAVMRHADLLPEGFWEVEFHRRFEREGLTLRMEPAASATLIGPVSFGAMFHQRFQHGVEFGFSRVHRHHESRLKLLLAAPLVPLVLLARIGKRAWAARRNRGRFVAVLPRLAVLATSWACGEAIGALHVRSRGLP